MFYFGEWRHLEWRNEMENRKAGIRVRITKDGDD